MSEREEVLARKFHEMYERLAPQFGYTTRLETREFDPNSPNGRLMIAVCAELLSPARNVYEIETVEAVLTAALAWYEDASIADAEDNENLYESVWRFKNALKVTPAPPSAEVRPKPGHCLLDIPQGTPCAMAGYCLEAERTPSGEDKIYTKEDAERLCEIAVAAYKAAAPASTPLSAEGESEPTFAMWEAFDTAVVPPHAGAQSVSVQQFHDFRHRYKAMRAAAPASTQTLTERVRIVEAARKTVYEFYQYYDGPEHSLSCLAEVIDSLDKALPEPEPFMLKNQSD